MAKLKRCKIAVVSTNLIQMPPQSYSGLEQIAWEQARGLARRGHDVILVGPKGSKPPDGARLWETALGEIEMNSYAAPGYVDMLMTRDVVIDDTWEKFAYLLKIRGLLKCPVLGVLHAPIEFMYQVAPPVPFPCFVAISKDQASDATGRWGVTMRVCYNGIDVDRYKPLSLSRGDRYLFLGRMSIEKGPHIAVDVARRTGIQLDLVGDDKLIANIGLVHRLQAQAQATPNITYVGPASREKCVEFFSTRKALLHPVKFFKEPFGMAPVEAQLCGQPVIAWDNGAMRETVKCGETGFLVKSQEEIEKLVRENAVASIKPERCREWASQFSVQAMTDRLEELIAEALDTGGW